MSRFVFVLLLCVSKSLFAWEPNAYAGISLAGPSLGFSAGTRITEQYSARFIFGGDTGELITDGNFQAQLLYFPRPEKPFYLLFGLPPLERESPFLRAAVGRNWNINSWRINLAVGFNIKTANRDEKNIANIGLLQPFGLGLHYVFE